MQVKYFKWFVLIGSFMTVLTTCGLVQSIGLFVTEWQEEFDASAEEIGWIGSCFIFGYAVAGLLVATISSSVSCRGVTMLGGVMACACMSLANLLATPWQLCLAMLMTGFGLGCALTGSLTVIGFYFKKNAGVVNGIIWAGGSFGLLILPPLLRYLIDMFSWRGAMLISASVVANVCVYGILFRSTKSERLSQKTSASTDGLEPQYEKKVADNEKFADVQVCFNANGSTLTSIVHPKDNSSLSFQQHTDSQCSEYKHGLGICRQIKGLQKYPVVCLCLNSRTMLHFVCQFLKGFGNFGAMVYFVSLAVDNDISKNRATFLLSLMGVTGTIVRLGHGIILDKKLITPIHMQSISMVLGGGSCILIAHSNSYVAFTAFAATFGSCNGIYLVMSPVILRQMVDARQIQAAIALGLSAICIGSFAGVPSLGALFDSTQSYAVSYYVAGSVLITGGLIHPVDHLLVRYQREKQKRNVYTDIVL